MAARESQLGEVQQQAEAHAKRVAQLEAEKAGMAAAHYKQVGGGRRSGMGAGQGRVGQGFRPCSLLEQ